MSFRQRLIFVRHTPPSQLTRRIYMRVKRKIADKLLSAPTLLPYQTRPRVLDLPHLHSPHGIIEKTINGWHAEFVGITRTMGDTIDWSMRADDSKAQLWRMNLHYFEYLPTLSPGTAEALIIDWIKHSRPKTSVSSSAGWTPYALSLRISAWLNYWSIHGPFGTDHFQTLFSASLREQANYLAANLETDVKGNHLIKNIRALAEMGAAYDDESAKRWSKIAHHHLIRELKAQILSDGVHFERSASYHAQVFCDLLTIYTIHPQGSLKTPLLKTLGIMANALQDLTHPDSHPIHFNDSGLTMCVAPEAALSCYKKLVSSHSLAKENRTFAYPEAGFYGTRTDTDYYIVKMGLLGPHTLMAHAHADWGSLEYSFKGQRLFVDQGVYEYVNGPDRDLSRSTRSHNTAMLDDLEQAHFFGSFRCGARPSPQAAIFKPKENGFDISATLDLKDGPNKTTHMREINVSAEQFIITDRANDSETRVTSRLLLHPDVTASIKNKSIHLITPAKDRLMIECGEGQSLDLETAEWFPDMGKRVDTHRIVVEGSGETHIFITRHIA